MLKNFVLAVASGKGGTGKTTIATNLAKFISRSQDNVQYLDCDVEEPNGHIFLKPDIELTESVFVNVPKLDKEKCSGCGKCGQLCQYNAIVHLAQNNVLTFPQLCHSCGGCIRICPENALSPQQVQIGQIIKGRVDNFEFVNGTLKIGNIRTVSLINQVKENIKEDSLAILDVPPGTSCPVVAAVKDVDFVLLVTEPTPFGLNDLKLAVGLVRKMDIPFVVALNRFGLGFDQVEKYCHDENIKIALKLPDDINIAKAYSKGKMITEELPKYNNIFEQFYKYLQNQDKA